MSWIVKAILAVIVLVILIAVFYGVGGRSVGKLGTLGEKTTTGADLQTVKASCTDYCNDAKQLNTPDRWKPSRYCSAKFALDLDNDGEIDPSSEVNLPCYHPAIGVTCTATMTTFASSAYCSNTDCEAGCPGFVCKKGSGADDYCVSLVSTVVSFGTKTDWEDQVLNSLKTYSSCLEASKDDPACTWRQDDRT